MPIKTTQKVAQRDNNNNLSGTVYCLDTFTNQDGTKDYMFALLDGEFGMAYNIQWYKRLPNKIKNLFN